MIDDKRPGILFLEALATIAGGQTVLLNLVPSLVDHFQVAALLPGEGPLAVALRALGVECFMAPIGRYSLMRKSLRDVIMYGMRTPSLVWRTVELIRQWQPDLVYANSGPTFVWGTLAAQKTGSPMIWHHHNLLADGKTLTMVRTVARLPAVRTIICASAAAQEQLKVVDAKTMVIPNGVDLERFQPDPHARVQIRGELGIDAAAPVVGMVGDLIPLKRQDTLLATLPALLAELPEIRMVLVGDVRTGDDASVDYAEELRRIAGEQVLFVGRRSDLPAVLNALDLMVVASERETGPLVLMEALATGIPVLSTPVGRAPELLETDALFPVGDTAALADRLRIAFAAPTLMAARRAAARRLAERQLSLVKVNAEIASVLWRTVDAQQA